MMIQHLKIVHRHDPKYRTAGWKLGIRVGSTYKYQTPRGFMIVQVLALHKRLVTVREVEDTPQFKVDPLQLERYP